MSLVRRFFTVSGLTVLSRILGVFREAALLHFLGATAEMDAFTIAYKFPNFFRRFFEEGGFQSIFVPYFSDYYSVGKLKGAGCFASRLFSLIFWVMLFFSILVFVFAKQFAILMAPGFINSPEKLALAVEFTRIIFPTVMFISLSTIYSGMLISRKVFFPYAMAPVWVNAILIGSLFIGKDILSAGRRISYGLLAAAIFLYLYMLLHSRREKLPRVSLSSIKLTTGIKRFLKKLTPVLVGAGIAQVNVFTGSWFASILPTGCITYIYCADRFVQLPLALFGISMGLVLLPEISESLAVKKNTDLKGIRNRSLLFTMRLTFPSVIGLIALSYHMISLIYGHGKFTEDAARSTSYVLKIVSIGLPAYVASKIISSVLFAQKDAKTPVLAAIISIATNIVLSFILVFPFKELGIAAANAIAGFANVYFMCRRSGWWSSVDKAMIVNLIKIAGSSIVMMIFLLVITTYFEPNGKVEEMLFIAAAILIGIGVYVFSLYFLKDESTRACIRLIRQRISHNDR
ncbi:MAG: murein biosynthesis integral membrane protein MurJ [Holosporales bacterium]|jgi:putative peptidoglycan lipid II flippase|nr:murein biosynthesis integral membrane protein MurJ [Holosporales bacterium]